MGESCLVLSAANSCTALARGQGLLLAVHRLQYQTIAMKCSRERQFDPAGGGGGAEGGGPLQDRRLLNRRTCAY